MRFSITTESGASPFELPFVLESYDSDTMEPNGFYVEIDSLGDFAYFLKRVGKIRIDRDSIVVLDS